LQKDRSVSREALMSSMAEARRLLKEEAEAVERLARQIDQPFLDALDILVNGAGKIFVSGLGKSGLIARKIAATMSSTGTPAYFIHPVEALHGDMGLISPGDTLIALSHSGSSEELLRPVRILKGQNVKIIAMTSNLKSRLAQMADVVLDIGVKKEACPLGLAPTTSTTATLAMGDALAAGLIVAKGIRREDFARLHPGGALGRKLLMKVEEVMHPREEIAAVSADATIRDAVVAMTRVPLGAVCVVDDKGRLAGIMTDGDVRRLLLKRQLENQIDLAVSTVMTRNPVKVRASDLASYALVLMEDRPSQISVLPVVADDSDELKGLIRLHDLIQLGMR